MLRPARLCWWLYLLYVVILIAFFFGITRSSAAIFLGTRAPQFAIDFVQLSIIWFIALNIGYVVIQRLHLSFASLGDLVVHSIALGFGLLSLLVFGVGLASLLYDWVGWAILLLGSCWAAIYTSRAGLAKVLLNQRLPTLNVGAGYVGGLSLVVAASVLVYSLVVNALVPPLEWDSMAYHLAIPKLYIAAHQITYIPYIVHSNWPFNMEMLYTFAFLVGSERLPQLISFSFSILTGIAMYSFAIRYFDRRVGLLALPFFFSLTIIRKVSGTAMIDISLGLFAFLAVVGFWRWLEEQKEGWLALSALFCGFAAGTKLTGASTGLLLGAGLLALAVLRSIRTRRLALREVLLFGTISLLPVVPWYLKSYVMTGNPVWPFLDQVFPSRDWDAFGTFAHDYWLHLPGTGTSIASLLSLPWNLFMSGSFGPALGIPGIVFLPFAIISFRKSRLVWFLTVFMVAMTLVWFYLTQQNRFLTPVFPIVCLLAGVGYWSLYDSAPNLGRYALVGLLTFWMVMSSPYLSVPEKGLWGQRLPYVTGQVSRETLLRDVIGAYDVFTFANSNLPATAKILLLPYENRGYYLDRAYVWGNPVSQRFLKFNEMEEAAALSRKARELGLSHVLINPAVDLPQMSFAKQYNALIDEFRRSYLTPIYSANGVTLYEVGPKNALGATDG